MKNIKFRRDLRYTLCEDKLEDFHDDLIMLDDWIPFVITSNLSQDVFFKLGKDVENKEEYSNRLLQHKLDNGQSGLSWMRFWKGKSVIFWKNILSLNRYFQSMNNFLIDVDIQYRKVYLFS